MLDGTEYFECSCGANEHTIRFTLDLDLNGYDEPMLYTSVFLDDKPFFSRIWIAIKYIFGYKCRYGHFGNWSMRENDVVKLEELLHGFQQGLMVAGRGKFKSSRPDKKPPLTEGKQLTNI